MSRRRKPKHSIPLQAHPATSDRSVPAGGGIERTMQPSVLPQDLFKPLFEKALDSAKSALHAAGTMGFVALFVYGKGLKDGKHEESTVKIVSVRWKNESHKEAVRMRIHEKAELEGASAIVLLMPGEAAGPREGTLLIAGVMPGMTANATVAYSFDKENRTFSFSELAWRDEPKQNFFLRGLFGAAQDGVAF